MKVIILDAGMGTRLGAEAKPKGLLPLATGRLILEQQLDCLERYLRLKDVRIVVGYESAQFTERYPHLSFVHNHQFAVENTAQSLLRALEDVEQEDVLWLNGDVVFHHSVLAKMLTERRNSILVNVSAVGDEEVKYLQDDRGRILAISKGLNEAPGEALGINFVTASDLPLFKEALSECSEKDYFERAVQELIDAGVEFWGVETDPQYCVEVDDASDLEVANQYAVMWEQSIHNAE